MTISMRWYGLLSNEAHCENLVVGGNVRSIVLQLLFFTKKFLAILLE